MSLLDELKEKAKEAADNVQREWNNAVNRGDSDKSDHNGGGKERPSIDKNPDPTGGKGTVPGSDGMKRPIPTSPNMNPVTTAVNPFLMSKSTEEATQGNLNMQQILELINKGQDKSKELTGVDNVSDIGEGRAGIREQLQRNLEGNSAAVNRLTQDRNQQSRDLVAQQMVAGGGQMNEGQRQALNRKYSKDIAQLKSMELNRDLGNLSKEWRGVASDTVKQGTGYAALGVGAQPPSYIGGGGEDWLSGLWPV